MVFIDSLAIPANAEHPHQDSATTEIQPLPLHAAAPVLADGRLCVAMAWVGHALTASARNPALSYRIPDEGAMVFIDSLAIPANAEHPHLAYRFIDYLLEPRNALADARASQFYSPLAADTPELAELAKERPMQVLKSDERRRLYVLERLNQEQKMALDAFWAKLKASRSP
eukprot:gene14067-17194_t